MHSTMPRCSIESTTVLDDFQCFARVGCVEYLCVAEKPEQHGLIVLAFERNCEVITAASLGFVFGMYGFKLELNSYRVSIPVDSFFAVTLGRIQPGCIS